ncbi:S9 family peptidase [Sinosporangium siamense]|uniref:Dipeptidyl peptidase IV n=1 Tax=Sinosporangium siamense TaxID=1367973 RepID=A0A919V911_9ACTN|nr:prolyl oligopeptidase family serine peptidase [Sinosporangium siamense]GII93812.1 putative dipeptidyl peptidase IV [Sinosporangium siamense]
MRDAYERADRLTGAHADKLIFRASVAPVWVGTPPTALRYLVRVPDGHELIEADLATGERRVAARVTEPGGESLSAVDLTGEHEVTLGSAESLWTLDLATGGLTRSGERDKPPMDRSASPCGKHHATVADGDLHVDGRRLTHDAEPPGLAYARPSDQRDLPIVLQQRGLSLPPLVVWSPDGERLATVLRDQRHVPVLPLTQAIPPDGGPRPILHTLHYEMPGDPLPTVRIIVFHAETGKRIDVDLPPLEFTYGDPVSAGNLWWSEDGGTLWLLHPSRGHRSLTLYRIDPGTGAARVIVEESGGTIVQPGPSIVLPRVTRTTADGEVLWFSERDGWGRLYSYDARTGDLKAAVTESPGIVTGIAHVEDRTAYVSICGREPGNPYHRYLYAADLDGGGQRLLTPERGDHHVVFSPDGKWFVDTYGSAGTAPVTLLRDASGAVVAELETADLSRLLATGWRAPEEVSGLAADGETEVWGLLYTPSTFDPEAKYPVVDSVYPGPQIIRQIRVPGDGGLDGPFLIDELGHANAVAELGFAVLVMDGRGTPFRSRAFADVSYGRLETAGSLEDHVALLKQLAADRPWLDLERAGIYGHSGGGFATATAMMRHPGFYKVGVASAGNHDQRSYYAVWGETYHGAADYAEQAVAAHAERLAGKLFLVTGEMDDNVHPGMTYRLVRALIDAGKDFDLLVVPGAAHSYLEAEPYVLRRQWDFLVRHLLGAEPPAGVRLSPELGRLRL